MVTNDYQSQIKGKNNGLKLKNKYKTEKEKIHINIFEIQKK